jgi:hypothetical protein
MNALLAADGEDRHDVGMVQLRRGLGLGLEPAELWRVQGRRERQDLQGDPASGGRWDCSPSWPVARPRLPPIRQRLRKSGASPATRSGDGSGCGNDVAGAVARTRSDAATGRTATAAPSGTLTGSMRHGPAPPARRPRDRRGRPSGGRCGGRSFAAEGPNTAPTVAAGPLDHPHSLAESIFRFRAAASTSSRQRLPIRRSVRYAFLRAQLAAWTNVRRA